MILVISKHKSLGWVFIIYSKEFLGTQQGYTK